MGGLGTVNDNAVRDSLIPMATKYFTPSSVHDKPIKSSGWDKTGPKHADVTINDTSDHVVGLRRDLQIRHLWQHQTDTIIDVTVTDTYSKTYIYHPLDNVAEMQEKENKRNLLLPIISQRKPIHTIFSLIIWHPWS